MTKSAKIPETWLRGDLIHTNYYRDNTEQTPLNKRPKIIEAKTISCFMLFLL